MHQRYCLKAVPAVSAIITNITAVTVTCLVLRLRRQEMGELSIAPVRARWHPVN